MTGTVTYKGQPIPEGMLVFEPDSSQGNEGAPGSCKILDGKYDTRSGRGVIGGPHKITISGMNGKIENQQEGGSVEIRLPTPLFKPYTVLQDLPKQDSNLDFEVPSNP
ncbi:MAG: hypothetical protein KDB03_10300 [Planctomycetales bacterium]|nr:hypothetical protein [Planctomycetales bacterium]